MKKLIVLGIFLTALIYISNTANGQNRQLLFKLNESPRTKPASEKSSIAANRESIISFDLQNSNANSERLTFPLFDGKIYEAVRVESEFRALDDFTWRGKLTAGKFSGDVVLTFKKGYVSGLIYAPNAVYEIEPKGANQVLIELDQSRFPECAGDVKGEEPSQNLKANTILAGTDSGDRIDVLILYTTPVKNSLGGEAQAQVFAQQAIDITNTTYRNSKIRQRVRLANAQETPIAETGSLGTELSALRSSLLAASLREQYKADLVAIISNSIDNCGIGYLMGSTAGNPNNGFTANSRTCAVGNLSFPHELGHNMGSQHNPENGSGATYSYGYGHYVNGVFRTVMSYVDPCTSGCVRQPYFSNPAISYNGLPTGIANARDNARSINNTADALTNYRYSGSSLTLLNYNGGEMIPRIINRTINWSSDNLDGNVKIEISRDASTSWETLIANTPNDGSEIVNITGRPTRQARIRVSSINNLSVSDSSVNNISIR